MQKLAIQIHPQLFQELEPEGGWGGDNRGQGGGRGVKKEEKRESEKKERRNALERKRGVVSKMKDSEERKYKKDRDRGIPSFI